MSLSTRSYSKESRSASYYSRSSSYHASGSNSYNSSYNYGTFNDARPLSTRLIERDFSYPSLSWDWDFNDPFFFDRIRWRFDDEFFKWKFGLGRNIPITYSKCNSGILRILPIQYIPSLKNRRHQLCKRSNTLDDLALTYSKHHDENSMRKYTLNIFMYNYRQICIYFRPRKSYFIR